MKKILTMILISTILLTGCIQVSVLQELAVVQGIAVDYADGQYELTLQLFSAEGSGGQTILDPSKQNAQTITCSGPTVAEALSRTTLSQGRSFFLGHDRLLILGEGTRELPLADLLKELTGSLSLREDVILLAAEGRAADVLNTDVNQGVLPAMTIEQTVENASDEGRMPETRILELNRSLAETYRSAVIPVISLPDSQEGDLKTFVLSGAAVYSDDQYRALLEEDELSGLLLFENKAGSMSLSAAGRSCRLYSCRTKLIPDLTDGVGFILRVRGNAALCGPAASLSDREIEQTEELMEQRLRECCEKVFDKAVRQNGCDILGMGDVVRWGNPEVFRILEGDWEKKIADIRMDYDIEIVLNRFQEN